MKLEENNVVKNLMPGHKGTEHENVCDTSISLLQEIFFLFSHKLNVKIKVLDTTTGIFNILIC